jgi:hypothetical protein
VKLHYFHQPEPDPDDALLLEARRSGWVPEGCLLGGVVLKSLSHLERPCYACSAPRSRCGGLPKRTTEELDQMAEVERLRRLLVGDGPGLSPLDRLRTLG